MIRNPHKQEVKRNVKKIRMWVQERKRKTISQDPKQHSAKGWYQTASHGSTNFPRNGQREGCGSAHHQVSVPTTEETTQLTLQHTVHLNSQRHVPIKNSTGRTPDILISQNTKSFQSQSLKNGDATPSIQAISKQAVGWIWPAGWLFYLNGYCTSLYVAGQVSHTWEQIQYSYKWRHKQCNPQRHTDLSAIHLP